jgi:hypothetical protein
MEVSKHHIAVEYGKHDATLMAQLFCTAQHSFDDGALAGAEVLEPEREIGHTRLQPIGNVLFLSRNGVLAVFEPIGRFWEW